MTEYPLSLAYRDLLTPELLSQLKGLLGLEQKSVGDFKTSHVFNRITKENVVDQHLRASTKIEYRDPVLFDWVQTNIVNALNVGSTDVNFNLLRNDLEVVKYEEGDFFRKHQDYVNFDSNEFRNYTFLVCLQACEEGGHTLLYLDGHDHEPTQILETSKFPGSVLVMMKTVVHEGEMVKKGSKILFKGNLLGIPKSRPQEDILVISLAKAYGRVYLIPIKHLEKFNQSTVYWTFYQFEKRQDPKKYIFYFHDQELEEPAFLYFYQKILGLEIPNQDMLGKVSDYLGIHKLMIGEDNGLSRFNHFLLDKNMHICPTSLEQYYRFLQMIDWNDHSNILPYQTITFEAGDRKILVWSGIYDNLFLTCEPAMVGSVFEDWQDDFEGSEFDFDDLDDSEIEVMDNQQKFKKNLINLSDSSRNKFKIRNVEDFIPERRWSSLVEDSDFSSISKIRKAIWKNTGLSHLSDIVEYKNKTTSDVNNKDGLYYPINDIYEYVNWLMDGISHNQSDSVYVVGEKKNKSNIDFDVVIADQPIFKEHLKIDDKLRENLLNLNVNRIIDRIYQEKLVTNLDHASMSDFFCNETYYITWDIVFRCGFLKLSDEDLTTPPTPDDSEEEDEDEDEDESSSDSKEDDSSTVNPRNKLFILFKYHWNSLFEFEFDDIDNDDELNLVKDIFNYFIDLYKFNLADVDNIKQRISNKYEADGDGFDSVIDLIPSLCQFLVSNREDGENYFKS